MTAPFHIVLICFVLFFRLWIMLWVGWDSGKTISRKAHIWRWLVRALPVVFFSFVNFGFNWQALAFAGVFAFWFWIDFDATKNIVEGKVWYAIGNTAFFDRIFPTFAFQFIVKIILLIASLFFYIQWSL